MAEPGFGWDLWRFTGLGDTGHGLPSRYLKGRSADTDNKGECLHQGGSRPNPPMLQGAPASSGDSHTQTRRRLTAWQRWGLTTSAHEDSGSPPEQCPGLLPHKL